MKRTLLYMMDDKNSVYCGLCDTLYRICMLYFITQIRFLELLGDFKETEETTVTTLKDCAKEQLINNCLNSLYENSNNHKRDMKILVCSDSILFLMSYAKKIYSVAIGKMRVGSFVKVAANIAGMRENNTVKFERIIYG